MRGRKHRDAGRLLFVHPLSLGGNVDGHCAGPDRQTFFLEDSRSGRHSTSYDNGEDGISNTYLFFHSCLFVISLLGTVEYGNHSHQLSAWTHPYETSRVASSARLKSTPRMSPDSYECHDILRHAFGKLIPIPNDIVETPRREYTQGSKVLTCEMVIPTLPIFGEIPATLQSLNHFRPSCPGISFL